MSDATYICWSCRKRITVECKCCEVCGTETIMRLPRTGDVYKSPDGRMWVVVEVCGEFVPLLEQLEQNISRNIKLKFLKDVADYTLVKSGTA